MGYAVADAEERYRVASTARTKLNVVKAVLDRHPGEPALVIGAYLEQLDELGEALGCPVVQGSTRNREREVLFDAFRRGEVPRLVVSKVANFSIDLPEASVAVQVSGTFPAGGGTTPGPPSAAQGRRASGLVLLGGLPGHRGHRVRGTPATLSRRAGICLSHRRR